VLRNITFSHEPRRRLGVEGVPCCALPVPMLLPQIQLTPDALEQFAAFDLPVREVVAVRLFNLSDGNWNLLQHQDPASLPPAATLRHDLSARVAERRQYNGSLYGSEESCQDLMVRLSSVRAYSTAFLNVGRVVFEVVPGEGEAPKHTGTMAKCCGLVEQLQGHFTCEQPEQWGQG